MLCMYVSESQISTLDKRKQYVTGQNKTRKQSSKKANGKHSRETYI